MAGPPKGHPPYNVNGEGGRPRIYDDVFIEKLADELDEWLLDENNCWVGRFFDIKGLNPDCGADFSARNSRFLRSYQRGKKLQEGRIYMGALKNKYNARIAEFGLMHNHGWTTKTESKISGDAANPLMMILNQTKELVNDSTE